MTRAKRHRRLKNTRVKRRKQKKMTSTHKDYNYTQLDSLLDMSLSDEESEVLYNPDPRGWFQVHSLSLSGIKNVCSWCCGSVLSGLSSFSRLMFSRSSYKKELQLILNKVQLLEEEINKLKSEREDLLTKHMASATEQHCSCQQMSCHSLSLPVLTPPAPPSAVTAPPLAPPPPPPPPPPIASLPKPLVIKRKGLQNRDQNVKDAKPVITVGDLQRVKLKKVDHAGTPPKRKVGKENQPLVTVSAIKKIKLKKSGANEIRNGSDALRRLPSEVLQCKLRKTNIEKSPGGTPLLINRNFDKGTGLTPLMTRALKKKFLFARTPSPENGNIQETACEM